MRVRVQALAAGAVLAVVAVAPAQASHFGTGAALPRAFAVGYSTPAALRTAVARTDAHLVRVIPDLQVAEVETAAPSRLSHARGIRFVQRTAHRRSADIRDPALALAVGKTVPWEWQFTVTRED